MKSQPREALVHVFLIPQPPPTHPHHFSFLKQVRVEKGVIEAIISDFHMDGSERIHIQWIHTSSSAKDHSKIPEGIQVGLDHNLMLWIVLITSLSSSILHYLGPKAHKVISHLYGKQAQLELWKSFGQWYFMVVITIKMHLIHKHTWIDCSGVRTGVGWEMACTAKLY